MTGLFEPLQIRPATAQDVPLILEFIRGLAAYEKLLEEVEATEARLHETLFGAKPLASCYWHIRVSARSHSRSTISLIQLLPGLPGLYLEDLFVKPEFRGQDSGRALLRHLAKLAKEEGCWRIEWARCLGTNRRLDLMRAWALFRWTTGRSIDCRERRLTNRRRRNREAATHMQDEDFET